MSVLEEFNGDSDTPQKESCKYCTHKHTNLPIETNVEDSLMFAIIAKGHKKYEIVLNTKAGVIGIEIDKCPYCGRTLNV